MQKRFQIKDLLNCIVLLGGKCNLVTYSLQTALGNRFKIVFDFLISVVEGKVLQISKLEPWRNVQVKLFGAGKFPYFTSTNRNALL